MNRNSNASFQCVLMLLLATSCFLHFWKLGRVPAGLFSDECCNAYNAFCISETGADEWGTRYPVFFRGFGEYHDPVMVYSLVPLIKVFGMEEWVTRFPSALFHILASVMLAVLVQEYCHKRWISLASGFVFSVIPWVFPVSRANSAGYTPMLFGLVVGWLCLLRAFERKSHAYAVFAGAGWAFVMYVYSIGRPMTALLLLGFAICFYRAVLSHWKIGLTFLTAYLAALLPMIISVLSRPEALTTRFQTLSIFQDRPPIWLLLERFGSRFVEYFSPQFLFLSGGLQPPAPHRIRWGTFLASPACGSCWRLLYDTILPPPAEVSVPGLSVR